MKFFILVIGIFFTNNLFAEPLFKKYISYSDVFFKDGHLQYFHDSKHVKLKCIRASREGIFFAPSDVCKIKHKHTSHYVKGKCKWKTKKMKSFQ